MIKSLLNLGKDIVETAAAPVEAAADLTRVATKPMADVAKAVRDEVKEATQEVTGEKGNE